MLETIAKLFELATHFPELTGFKIHREPNTKDCTDIESVGVNIRSVKVEFIRYKHCGQLQVIVMIHHPQNGTSMFMHNDQRFCLSKRAGELLQRLITQDLAEQVSDAEFEVFTEGARQLEASNAIRKSARAVTLGFADEFISQTTDGNYKTVAEFLNQPE